MKLAQATFPEDAARRIVLVSDGNQNQGNALEQAQAAGGGGHRHRRRAGPLPQSGRRGRGAGDPARRRPPRPALRPPRGAQQHRPSRAQPGDAGEVPGALGSAQDRPTTSRSCSATKQHVTLPPGKKVFTIRQQIDAAELLHLRGPLRPRPARRRRHAAEQPGHGLHPRAAARGRCC